MTAQMLGMPIGATITTATMAAEHYAEGQQYHCKDIPMKSYRKSCLRVWHPQKLAYPQEWLLNKLAWYTIGNSTMLGRFSTTFPTAKYK